MMASTRRALQAAPPALLFVLITLFSPAASGQPAGKPAGVALPAGVEQVNSIEGITEYRLANGLRVLLFPDPSRPTVTVNVTYLVGSRFESYGETGMAHLLEHMVFKGTPKHPNIPQELTAHGAEPNGSTTDDRTNYFEVFAATDENLDWALDLEADRMVHSFIAKKDLDSEMTVVRNEYELGENSPAAVTVQRTTEAAFVWHNYGHPTIGARSDIENVPIERLQAFYRKFYQPDNAVLLVAGKFDPARTLGLIARKFGPLARPERTLPAIYTVEPTQDGERQVTVRRVGDAQLVVAAYHIPAGAHPDSAAVTVLTRVLGDRAAGRLRKALVETGKAADVFAFDRELHDPGLAFFGARVRKEGALEPARQALLDTVEAPHFAPVTGDEVERASAALLKEIDVTLHSSTDLGLELSEWVAQGDWRLFFLQRDRIGKVTPADVQRVAASYLKPTNRTVGLFIPEGKPERAEIPARPDTAALLAGYKGQTALAEGEAFDASPANILARTTVSELTGGLKLALLPKKTRGESVAVHLSLHLGDEAGLQDQATAGGFAADMLMRGSRRHTRKQIEDELAKLKAEVTIGGSAEQVGVSIQTVRANLPAVLRLVAEVLREPAFPADELEQLRQQQLVRLEALRSDPQAVAVTSYRRHVAPRPKGHPQYVMTLEERAAAVKALTREEVTNFYARFYGASRAELAAVGDFAPKELEGLVREILGSWKSPSPYQRIADTYAATPPARESFETPDKASAVLIAGLRMPLRDDDPDFPALELANEILGGGFLNSRLATRIRQKDGLSYGIGSVLSASALDKVGDFMTFAAFAPQNAAKLEADLHEEVDRAVKAGFTAEEVAAAKTGFLQQRQLQRAEDLQLAGTLAHYLFTGRTFQWDADFEQRITALQAGELGTALRRQLDPAKLVIVRAGDFAHAAATPGKSN